MSSLLSGCRTGLYHFASKEFDDFASFVNAYHKDQSNQLEEEKYLFEIKHLDQYRFVYVSQGITRRDDGSVFFTRSYGVKAYLNEEEANVAFCVQYGLLKNALYLHDTYVWNERPLVNDGLSTIYVENNKPTSRYSLLVDEKIILPDVQFFNVDNEYKSIVFEAIVKNAKNL